MSRKDMRATDELRPIRFIPDIIPSAAGSVEIQWGNTHVLCSIILENQTVRFREGTGLGWLTAEYSMHPASTPQRKPRYSNHQDGRSVEIQRLIGRSLRAVMDFEALGEKCIYVDCEVLQADGGTRTASITGSYVALAIAVEKWLRSGVLDKNPLQDSLAAVSVGIIDDEVRLDLPYEEDSRAMVDMNIVMTGNGRFVEIQGTGEGRAFTEEEQASLMALAKQGLAQIREYQEKAIKEYCYEMDHCEQ